MQFIARLLPFSVL